MRFKDTLGISFTLKILQHELSQHIESRLTRLQLSLPQYTVLSCLEEGERTTNAELARKSSVTPQTMIRIMQNLERSGLVLRRAHREHGLKQEFTLSAKAKRLICDAHAEVNAVEVALVRKLSPKRLSELQASLAECLESLRRGGDEVV